MRKLMIVLAVCLGSQAFAQFKEEVKVNGVSYKASAINELQATYIQQDYFDFTLAADSFYVDVVTESQWEKHSEGLLTQGAVVEFDIYNMLDGRQLYISGERHKKTGDLMLITLYGSVDTRQ